MREELLARLSSWAARQRILHDNRESLPRRLRWTAEYSSGSSCGKDFGEERYDAVIAIEVRRLHGVPAPRTPRNARRIERVTEHYIGADSKSDSLGESRTELRTWIIRPAGHDTCQCGSVETMT